MLVEKTRELRNKTNRNASPDKQLLTPLLTKEWVRGSCMWMWERQT